MPTNGVTHLTSFGTTNGNDENKLNYKIVVMGSGGVGKTAIVQRFLYEQFPITHKPTVEELHCAQFELPGGENLVLDILDTSGTYAFPAMRRLAISQGDAFILVYSIDDNESFNEVRNLKDLINEIKSSSPIEKYNCKQMKTNERTNINYNEHKRIISKQQNGYKTFTNNDLELNNYRESNIYTTTIRPPIVVVANKIDLEDNMERTIGKELAETIITIDWENGYTECSSKNNENIVNIFQELLVQARAPYLLSPMTLRKRRQSLPNCPILPNKGKENLKRNSCAVS